MKQTSHILLILLDNYSDCTCFLGASSERKDPSFEEPWSGQAAANPSWATISSMVDLLARMGIARCELLSGAALL